MRVPVSWLYEFIDLSLGAEALADVLTIGGLEVEAVQRPTAGARGMKVVEVRDVQPVPKSDKLSLVQAWDGDREWEIVCGASNFAVGDRVPAALPGSVLPGGFEIGAKKLMGVTSNGMLASAREMGVGEDHSGIWLLGRDAPVGADVTEWLDLEEAVLDIDLTPDRGYGASIWSLARDLHALTGGDLRLPATGPNPGGDPAVPVTLHEGTGVRRWDGRGIEGVAVAPSPPLVQKRLALAGMRPISNVVDATNYAMLESGYPVHAYDRALLAGPELHVRPAEPGEVLTTLDGIERTLDPEDVVIADADGAVGLAGIMGGEATEIQPATTDLYVEVAAWDPVKVLRTGRRHLLFTEARSRFERTVGAEWLTQGASRVAELITAWAGGTVIGGVDQHPIPDVAPRIGLRPARVASVLGVDLPAERQAALLESLGCAVMTGDVMTVVPPSYRPDLLIEADLIEEVARLHGYDKIVPNVPSTGQSGRRSPEDRATMAVRDALAGAGWTEVLLYPFIADEDLERLGLAEGDPRRRTIKLVNPLSKEESVLRTSLLPGLLATVRRNVNRQNIDLALFETGHVFVPPSEDRPALDGGPGGVMLPAEPDHIALVATGAFVSGRHDREPREVDFYDVMGAVELLRGVLVAEDLVVERTDEMPFHPGRAARVSFGDTPIGVVGELHPRVCGAFGVPARTVAAELTLDTMVAGGANLPTAVVPSPLPGLRFDVAALVDADTSHETVRAAIAEAAGDRLTSLLLFDVFTGEQLGEGRKSLAYSLLLEDHEVQLTDTEEAEAIERIATAIESIGGQLRR